MISKHDYDTIIAEICAVLRESERYVEQDFLNRYSGFAPGEVRRAIWAARELVRAELGIVFGVTPQWPGNFRRLTWQQTANQAKRQRAAGTRKHVRARDKLRLAASHAPDEARERLNEAADRIAIRSAMRLSKD